MKTSHEMRVPRGTKRSQRREKWLKHATPDKNGNLSPVFAYWSAVEKANGR